MKEDRKFLRQCYSCRQYKKKEELIRITKDYKTLEPVLNKNNEYQGRSVYICKNEECVKKFIKNKKNSVFLTPKNSENIKKMLNTVLKK